ncbi:hypothetical protein [Haloterrigena alkaliphila]|uniref:Uncharacterized protein n=1 Tax=Haloterrigena alkaliphila TaxID=2816475 RepID=A0A8A2VCB5_9EURY|nr:hypothetical protein [Haloterrigena alkaliphila]QSW97825.1 hypothetical protein J0X25_10375 [Haloterrigena alkaliphila]
MSPSESDETLESFGADVGKGGETATRFQEWFLIQGSRLAVAAVLALAVLAALVAAYELDVVAFTNPNSVTRVASGMIAGTFSLVTLVVSVNQLILSQEFTTASKARDRLDGVIEFREDVADEAGIPASPAAPTRMLELLIEAIRHDAVELADAVADHDDEVRDVVIRYTNSIEERADRVDETLEETSVGTFAAVSATINYDEAWQLYVASHLRGEYADSLSPEATERLDELVGTLKLFNVAREQFKTTYLQRELTRFSQLTIYCGVPSILSAITIGLLYADFAGPTVNIAALPYATITLILVGLTPLFLLVSFILRTATVTRRTASIGPMIPQKDPDEGPFDVSYGEDR